MLSGERLFLSGMGWLYAIDPATGSTLWRSPDERELGGAPLVFADRVLMRDEHASTLVSLAHADGRMLGEEPLPRSSGFQGPTSDGSRLYLGDEDGYLMAFGANATLAWAPRPLWQSLLHGAQPGSLEAYVSPPSDPQGALAVGNGYLAVHFLDGSLTMYDTSGSELWHTSGTGEARGRPVIHGGDIFVATGRHHLMAYALADGAIRGDLASHNSGAPLDLSTSAPLIVGEHLFTALEHTAFAKRLEEAE